MSSKKYAFLPMEDDEVGPQKVAKEKKHKHRSRDRDRERDDKSSRSSRPRRDRSRSRSPRSSSHRHDSGRSKTYRRRDAEADFDDRWGDEEPPSDEPDAQDDGAPEFEESASKRVKLSHDEPREEDLSDGAKEELARQKDIEEREAFAKRLREKDEGRSKKNQRDGESSSRQRLADDAKARDAALPDLRERSRQEYLKKRETERLALLRKQVAEETAELRSGVRLSDKEKAEFAKNREILRLAEERGIDFEDGDVSLLGHESELTLVREMLKLPETVELIVDTLLARGVEASYLPDVDDIIEHLVTSRTGRDVALIMSNGEFGGIWERLLASLEKAGKAGKTGRR